ncbi:hypothetical protein FRB98_005938 [Tulasnella sp. 332]|nr:hypothetical protein FRB98_005938 [Tulasnella sp. 332]
MATNHLPAARVKDLCDPRYHAALGSPLFDFDQEWWEDIVDHLHQASSQSDPDTEDDDILPMDMIPEPVWSAPSTSTSFGTSPMMNVMSDVNQAPQLSANACQQAWSESTGGQSYTDWASYAHQKPCSLESSSSMSYSSSVLVSPASPGSRGPKRPSCVDDKRLCHKTTSTKRRRVSHPSDDHPQPGLASSSIASAIPKPRRFFIDDEADDQQQQQQVQHEGTWEIVQGAWWDTSKLVKWREWEYDCSMEKTRAYFSEAPGAAGGGVEGDEEEGPQSAPVICVKAMPALREPIPRLSPRVVDGAIEVLEQTVRLSRPRTQCGAQERGW